MFRKQKQIAFVLLLFLGMSAAKAQDTMKLTLQDALRLARQNNTNILNSELDLKIAQKKVWETTATGLPHIDSKGTYQHIFKVPVMSFPGTELSKTNVPYNATTVT